MKNIIKSIQNTAIALIIITSIYAQAQRGNAKRTTEADSDKPMNMKGTANVHFTGEPYSAEYHFLALAGNISTVGNYTELSLGGEIYLSDPYRRHDIVINIKNPKTGTYAFPSSEADNVSFTTDYNTRTTDNKPVNFHFYTDDEGKNRSKGTLTISELKRVTKRVVHIKGSFDMMMPNLELLGTNSAYLGTFHVVGDFETNLSDQSFTANDASQLTAPVNVKSMFDVLKGSSNTNQKP